jgi:hypothetical protein
MPKDKKNIKVRDLKPRKDAKGGGHQALGHQASGHQASGHQASGHQVSGHLKNVR